MHACPSFYSSVDILVDFLSLPTLCVLNELVEETNSGEMRVEVDTFVDGVVVEQVLHGRRREAIDVRRDVPVVFAIS